MPCNYTFQDNINQELSFLVDDQKNHAHYILLTSSDARKKINAKVGVVLPINYELIRVELNSVSFALVLLDHLTKRIAYYVKAQVWQDVVLHKMPVTQILLWRTNDVIHHAVTTGLANAVFFGYLLDRYNVVASDCHQTIEGRDFWIRQTGFALAYGLNVYRYHRIKRELCKIVDHATIRDNSCDLWGDGEDYMNILAIISKEDITPCC